MPGKGTDIFRDMTRPATLDEAWAKVRGNQGCAGGDGETIHGFGRRAAKRLLILSRALRAGRYRPRQLRILHIPKKSGGTRPLAIPSVEDRVAHTACAAILTPILDPLFSPASFAYRPGRSVQQAVAVIGRWRQQGFTHVVEADILRCFERIPQGPLLTRLEEVLGARPGAPRIVDIVALWLEQAGGALGTPDRGLPQGSPLSPLLANLWLDGLDDALMVGRTRLVRFADDFVLLCRSRAAARHALEDAREALDDHGLELRSDRTRIVDFDRGFEFLGHLFVRSMALKQVSDPDEDPLLLLRDVARRDASEAAAQHAAEAEEKAERRRGYDRGGRVLYLMEAGRRMTVTNLSFQVTDREGGEIIAVPHERVDRIEIGPGADAGPDSLRLALAAGAELAFVDGHGETEGHLSAPPALRAALHLAQAATVLDPVRSVTLARSIVEGRLRNQRAQLHRLNREAQDGEVIAAGKTLGQMIRKLPEAESVAALRGHEGAGAAVYWPALGRLCAEAPQPLRRDRPAGDPVNASINWLTFMLARDVRAQILRRGLHPGFGVLHVPTDGHEACVWDLMEGFRAALSEGLAVALFNQSRLKPEMFAKERGGVRIAAEGRRALVSGYETACGRRIKSPHSTQRRSWRAMIGEEAGAYAAFCRNPEAKPFAPHVMDY